LTVEDAGLRLKNRIEAVVAFARARSVGPCGLEPKKDRVKTLERVFAAVLVAGLAGLAFGVFAAIGVIAENGLAADGRMLGPLAAGAAGFPAGVAVFGIPLLAIVFLTRIRLQPWRAVPRLLAGTVLGLAVACGICLLPLGEWYSFMDYRGPGPLPAVALSIAFVTLGAYLSARTMPSRS
jgi:hypothetical protein